MRSVRWRKGGEVAAGGPQRCLPGLAFPVTVPFQHQRGPGPSLGKPEALIWDGGPASLPGGGVCLSPAPVAWPRFRPSALLGGQPPSDCLFQVRNREAPPKAPSSPHPPSSPAQKQPHAPPQPTAHKSLSPRDLACPFHVPAAGDLPFHCTDSCLSAGPSSMAVVRPAGPTSEGGEGALQGGKDSFATFPES